MKCHAWNSDGRILQNRKYVDDQYNIRNVTRTRMMKEIAENEIINTENINIFHK